MLLLLHIIWAQQFNIAKQLSFLQEQDSFLKWISLYQPFL